MENNLQVHIKRIMEDVFKIALPIKRNINSINVIVNKNDFYNDVDKIRFYASINNIFEKWCESKEINSIGLLTHFMYLYDNLENIDMLDWVIQYYILFCLIGSDAYSNNILLSVTENVKHDDKYVDSLRKKISLSGCFYEMGNYKIDSDQVLMHTIWGTECYKLEDCAIKNNDIVFDLGASKGESVIWFCDAIGKNGTVHAFEMQNELINILKQNIERNGFSNNVQIISKGAWDKEESVSLDHTGRITHTVQGEINTITLDNYVKYAGISKVDFIKMDIEGAEVNAIKGAKDIILKHQPNMAIAAYHNIFDPINIVKSILSINPAYRFYLSCKDRKDLHLILFAYTVQ